MGIGIGSNAIGYPRSLVDSMLTGVSGSLQTQISTLTSQTGSYAAASHIHGNITNGGAIGSISGLVATTTTGGVLTTSSRSGIDSRTSFPNDDVTASTFEPDIWSLVRRDNVGGAEFNNIIVHNATKLWSNILEINATNFSYGSGSASAHRTALGLGTAATANSSAFATATHAHGNISNSGAIGTTANLAVVTSTDGILTTQTRSGIDSRTSFPNDAVTSATSDATANSIVRRDSSAGADFVQISANTVNADNANFEGLTLNDNATFNATTYNFGTGAASSFKTAIGADSFEDQNILAVSLFA
jgi:hypothetical protein